VERRVSERYDATLTARTVVNPSLFVVRIRHDAGPIAFRAGQYAMLGLSSSEPRLEGSGEDPVRLPADTLIHRPFSIASGTGDGELEFLVRYVREGELAPRLARVPVGSRLYLSDEAGGTFTLDRAPVRKHLVLVATGTGIAPFVSYVRTHLRADTARRWVIVHGARYDWDLGYREELESAARECPHFTYIPTTTRRSEEPGAPEPTGRVTTLLADGTVESRSGVALDPATTDVFLCGNPSMIEDVIELLGARDYVEATAEREGAIHTERYW
jgi:ferredoxin--NADP+ reductase